MMVRRYSHAMYGSNRLKKYEKGSPNNINQARMESRNIHVARVLDSYMVN